MKKILSVALTIVTILSNLSVLSFAKEANVDADLGKEIVLCYLENAGCSSLSAVYSEYVYTSDFTKSAIKFGLDIGSSPSKAIQYLKDSDAYNNKLDLKYTDAANAAFLKAFGAAEVEFASIESAGLDFISELGSVSSSVNKLSKIDYDSLFAGLDNNYNSADTKYIKKALDEVFPKLKTIYPNLNKSGTLEKIYKKVGDTNILKAISKFADITDFLYKFMVHIETYEANLEKINSLLEIVDHNSTLGKGLIRMRGQYDDGILDFFSNPQCVEKIDNLISGEIIKAISVGSYGSLVTTTMSVVNVANKIIFDSILKTPDVSTAYTYNILQMYVADYSDILLDKVQPLVVSQNYTDFDLLVDISTQSITYFTLFNSVLEYGKQIAKYNDEYDVSFINGEIEKNNKCIEKFIDYLEELASSKKDSTETKKVPGTMTVSASKSNYTTKENVVLSWTSSSNAKEYGLTVKRVEDGKTIFNSRLNGSSKNLGCLEAGTYTYVMRGHNANGKGPLTPVKQFTVEASNKNNIPEGNGDCYLYKSLDKDTSKPDFPGKWIRTSASTSGTVIGSIPYGEMAVGTKFSSDGKWVYVNYKNVEGWVMLTNDIFPYQGIYTCPIVTFNANGGSVTISNKKVFINTPYGTLPTPVRNGYIFDGWYTSSNGGTKITSSTNVTLAANQTLYAHWVKYKEDEEETAKLTITFDPMGGKVSPTSKKGEFNTPYGSLPTPTRNGYVFLGWYTVKGGGGNEVTSTHYVMRNYDHTLYAHWDVSDDQTCIITYNANGGIEPPSPQTVNEGERVTISNEKLSRSGYEFLGWAKKASSNKADYTPGQKVTINEDITLYAVWKAKDESFVLTIGDTKANVFGQIKYNDVAPIIENNRTMLPARFIAENLGAEVEWIDKTHCVLITREDTEIEIFIGNEYAKVNGKKYKLDSPAFIRDNRTYTPVRFICENLGADVEWNSKERSVKITLVKCSVCGSTNHTEHIESDGWEESLPSFVKNNQDDYIIEKRTEYLYETRETTTSDKNKKSGWTLYDTKTSEGSWSKWQEQKVTETSTRIVETREVKATYKTQYNYGAYVTKAGTHKPCLHLTDSSQEVWTGWLDYELPIKYSPDDVKGWYCATCASKVDSSRAGGKIINVKDKGGNKYFWYTYYQNNATDNKNEFYWKNERVVEDTPSHTEYRYKNIENVYYFERWTEGEWTTKKKSENSNCRLVDTRTVYKYESR